MKHLLALLICTGLSFNALSQKPVKPSSADILHKLQKLQVLGSVLYVAAHPDDENTRMISHFANDRHCHTTYLSLTRGDGGQNLVGTEIRELLGAIRTQELLMARQTDGGNQRFTRANDFGYSKHPNETLQLWNKEDVLSDVIWTIRKTRPDIIINRFDHRSPGRTHGHHTSSAMLSVEAFDLVGSRDVAKTQLDLVDAWQPERLFFNTSWWFYGSRAKFAEADKSNMLSVDVGTFYPTKGKSNNEIASESRSMHKSQGFGSTGTRGSEIEYLELIKGSLPQDDPLGGIDISWSRIPGGSPIGALLATLEADFNHNNPSASVPALLEAYQMICSLDSDGFWVPMKKKEVEELLLSLTGTFVEAVADHYVASPGNSIPIYVEAINRSDAPIHLKSIRFPMSEQDTALNMQLAHNKRHNFTRALNIPAASAYTSPYWLKDEGSLGMYRVDDQELIGVPEPTAGIQMEFVLDIMGTEIPYSTTVVFKRNDPVKGEVYRPFEIAPPVFLQIDQEVYICSGGESKSVQVIVKNNASSLKGKVSLKVPAGWAYEPKSIEVSLDKQGAEALAAFTIIPPSAGDVGEVHAEFDMQGEDKTYDYSATIIEYDHIPTQTILKPATAKIVNIDLARSGDRVAYINGAGDKIPESLRQVGYEVVELQEENINAAALAEFDAVIMGIRAYNVSDRIQFYHDALMEYVHDGGTLLVQYNTSRRLKLDNIGPYPIKLSRDRVTVEEAEMRMLAPDHAALNAPNKITKADFDGWVQERGLYFSDEWDDQYTPLLSSNDPGEPPRDGGLLVTQYGKGHYIYSGYSWFRQLPAGVPGAYRLFVNLISLGSTAEHPTSGGQDE
ncbi:MAG: PIG-L family deacetylase [Saprospiraceae bacterium]|nr:PIG-L family deacetylase [Saprospiraceae bacterium]